jgi:gas vesicle protein
MFTAAMAGVVVGLLIAPAKGSETRQKIADSADQIKDRIRRMRGATNQELDELHEVFEHEIQGLRDDIREKVLKLIDLSKKSYNHIKAEAMS